MVRKTGRTDPAEQPNSPNKVGKAKGDRGLEIKMVRTGSTETSTGSTETSTGSAGSAGSTETGTELIGSN